MKRFEEIKVNSIDDYERLCNDLRNEIETFNIDDFYKSDNAKAIMIITPKQVIICPVSYHEIAFSSILNFLYSRDTDYAKIKNIVVRLDSNDDKFFIPIIPGRINKFQADVFSYYFNQLKPYSNGLKYNSPRSVIDWNYEEVKERFEGRCVDDSIITPEENIISLTREDWYSRQKVA